MNDLRRAVLSECMQRPKPVRELSIAVLDALTTPGHKLRHHLLWTDVPGKPIIEGDVNREREMRGKFYDVAALTLCKLISHMDIVTADVCRERDKTFLGIKVETIAETFDLCQRRVERALWVIHRAGIVQSTQRAEKKDDGSYRGHTAIRKLTIGPLLTLLGGGWASRWLQEQREEMRKRAELPPSPELLAIKAMQSKAARNAAGRTAAADGMRSVGSLLTGFAARYGPKPA